MVKGFSTAKSLQVCESLTINPRNLNLNHWTLRLTGCCGAREWTRKRKLLYELYKLNSLKGGVINWII